MKERWLGPFREVEQRKLSPEELDWLLKRRAHAGRRRLWGRVAWWGLCVLPIVLSSPLFFGTKDHWQPHLILLWIIGVFPGVIAASRTANDRVAWGFLKKVNSSSDVRVYSGKIGSAYVNLTVAELMEKGLLRGDEELDQSLTVLADSGLVLEANGARTEQFVKAHVGEVTATPTLGYQVPLRRYRAGKEGAEREILINKRQFQAAEAAELRKHLILLLTLGPSFGILASFLVTGFIIVALILTSRSEQFGARLPVGLGVAFLALYLERLLSWAWLLAKDSRWGGCVVLEVSGEEGRWEDLPFSKVPWIELDRPAAWRSEGAFFRLLLFLRSVPPIRKFVRPG
jgi:hypothetical protein